MSDSDILSIAKKNNYYLPKYDPVAQAYFSEYDPEEEMRYRKYRRELQAENFKKSSMTKEYMKHRQLAAAYIDVYGITAPIASVFPDYESLMDAFISCGFRRELSGYVISDLSYQYRNITNSE